MGLYGPLRDLGEKNHFRLFKKSFFAENVEKLMVLQQFRAWFYVRSPAGDQGPGARGRGPGARGQGPGAGDRGPGTRGPGPGAGKNGEIWPRLKYINA